MANTRSGVSVDNCAPNREERPGESAALTPDYRRLVADEFREMLRGLGTELEHMRRRNAEPYEPQPWARPVEVDEIGRAAGAAVLRAVSTYLKEEGTKDTRRICPQAVSRVLQNPDGTTLAVEWACGRLDCPVCRQTNEDDWIDRLPEDAQLYRVSVLDEGWRALKARLDRRGILHLQVPVAGGVRHVYTEEPLDALWDAADADDVRESLGLRVPGDKRRPRASQGFLEPSQRQERAARRRVKVSDKAMVVGAWDARVSVDDAKRYAEMVGFKPLDVEPTDEVIAGVAVKTGWTEGVLPSGDALKWLGLIGFKPFRTPLPVGDWRRKLAPEMIGDEVPMDAYEPPEPDPEQLAMVAA